MSEATPKVRSGYATYPDYEEADSARVDEMKTLVEASGGVVRRVIASEEDAQALVLFAGIPQGKAESFKAQAEDNGWSVEWRN